MGKKKLTREIIKGINHITTPQALTTELINQVISSPFVMESIHSMIINPVMEKTIPKMEGIGTWDFSYILWALYQMDSEVFIKNFITSLDDEDKDFHEEVQQFIDHSVPYYMFYEVNDSYKPKTILIRCKHPFVGNVLYITYQTDDEKIREFVPWINVRFFGIRAVELKKYFSKMIKDIKEMFDGKSSNFLNRRVIVRSFKSTRSSIGERSTCTIPKTIILDHVQKDLNDIMAMVGKSEDIAKRYDINKTLGILLYGPHGTGKSTIARWLAWQLNRELILTTNSTLDEAIQYTKRHHERKYILLIEDIDLLFTDRRRLGGTIKKKKVEEEEESSGATINKQEMAETNMLFQVMDGVLSDSNLMVVATTNYFERLDPALIRDGRFDFKLEVNGLSYEDAAKVCERFEITAEEANLSSWKTPILPASLQTFILKYKINADSIEEKTK